MKTAEEVNSLEALHWYSSGPGTTDLGEAGVGLKPREAGWISEQLPCCTNTCGSEEACFFIPTRLRIVKLPSMCKSET